MSDTRTTSTNGDASEEVVPCTLMDNSRETFNAKEEETRREGVTLVETPR